MPRPQAPFNGGLVELPDGHPMAVLELEGSRWEQSVWADTGRVVIHHAEHVCDPPCPVHRPGEHHMVTWPLQWRGDRRIFERLCVHGVGHPDPDSTAPGDSAHGCDGCCSA